MSTLRSYLLTGMLCTCFTFAVTAQSSLAYESGTAYRPAKKEVRKTPTPHRVHKKLPALYQGYAVEVATSTYPLDGTNGIFRKFGNIHYDKLERGSYSYLILGRFRNDASALHFLTNIIAPQVKEARVVHYKDGIRRIVRVQ